MKFLKWIGILLGGLIGLVLLAALVLFLLGNSRITRHYNFPASNLEIPTDAASIDYGRQRAEIFCTGCHGEDLGGVENWLAMGPLGTLDSANLTSGEGGVGREFTSDEDYVRVVRHGIDPNGLPTYMPAVGMAHLGDLELAAIIAYVKSVPPVDHHTRGQQFTPLAKIMLALNMVPAPAVEQVSHEIHVADPVPGPTAQYGEYLANVMDCHICHGKDLTGAPFPDPTVKVIAPDITPRGEVGYWTEDQLIVAFRTGVTPSGHHMDPELMPWKEITAKIGDDDMRALYMYLQSLPAE
jgi:mono/diheme cytochrome c family protein/cytochrome c553